MSIATDDLLRLNDNRMVEQVLASVGNGQRLSILLALLKKPMTVNQIIEAVGANSTGQVYHHLKPLTAADLVLEEKGVYAVVPHRVQGIIMLLAGVWDLIDMKYTAGSW
jgi:DNA gyrase subunit B